MFFAVSEVLQELGVHTLERHRHELACLLDAVGVGTHGVVTSSVVLLLLATWVKGDSGERREKKRR